MEIIITEDCSFKSEFEPIKNKIAEYFSKLSNLSTLKKVIITDHDFNNYSKSVKELSRDIDKNAYVSENGGAVAINGTNTDSTFNQYIFIRGDIFYAFLLYLCLDVKVDDNLNLRELAYSIVLHEIGHCIYSEILYTKYNYVGSNKKGYNLSLDNELDEYIYHECITLTSEYYAEHFMNSICKESKKDYTKEMLNIINDNYFDNRVNNIGKIYRLIYCFVLYISYYHTNSIKLSFYEDICNPRIGKVLKRLENEMIIFYDKFNAGDFNVNNIIDIFREIYNIKYSTYDKI